MKSEEGKKILCTRVNYKKLLILGATAGEISLVKRAQLYGVYVIVTDNHTDYTFAPAKYVADEAWDVSWSDLDELERRCRKEHIDGVLAGYSEFRVDNMMQLCERLHLPCYINREQLEITRDKIKFKECCRKYDVPVVKEYQSIEEVNEYPVIVKPTDRAGSIGISIAHNYDELKQAYQYAYDMSVEKRVIIEKYICDADKVDFYYLVDRGRITLLTSCDTINAKNNESSKVVQSAWLYPERHIDAYDSKVRGKVEAMIHGMEIQNGCIFFSGFIDANQEFVFFECGFRLEGAHQYYYTEKRGPVNFLDTFIFHALCGDTESILKKPINEEEKCVTINVFAKSGTIATIKGTEKIEQMKDCTKSLLYGCIGQQCDDSKAILDKVYVFAFSNKSVEKLKKDVDEAYRVLEIIDDNGNDMIYDRIDTTEILTWWKDVSVNIRPIEYDDCITYEEIQNLLSKAHRVNEEKGLSYATATQSVEKLRQKIGYGVCFVALDNSKLIGTATVCLKDIDYWYYTGQVVLIKLVAVDPENKHAKVGTRLIKKCIEYANMIGAKVVVTDSAEQNIIFKKLVTRLDFVEIDYCKYRANNFVSTVYALFIDEDLKCDEEKRIKQLEWKRKNIIEKE